MKKRHFNEIVEDVSDRFFALWGNAIHYILEQGADKDSLSEERLFMDVNGWKFSGQTDLYKDGKVSDYKTVSVFVAKHSDEKGEWEKQVNCLAYLFHENGFPVKDVEIRAIFRDFRSWETYYNWYPKCPVLIYPQRLWAVKDTFTYIFDRVKLFQETEKLPDNDLPLCHESELWGKNKDGKWKRCGYCNGRNFCNQYKGE